MNSKTDESGASGTTRREPPGRAYIFLWPLIVIAAASLLLMAAVLKPEWFDMPSYIVGAFVVGAPAWVAILLSRSASTDRVSRQECLVARLDAEDTLREIDSLAASLPTTGGQLREITHLHRMRCLVREREARRG